MGSGENSCDSVTNNPLGTYSRKHRTGSVPVPKIAALLVSATGGLTSAAVHFRPTGRYWWSLVARNLDHIFCGGRRSSGLQEEQRSHTNQGWAVAAR